MGTKSSGSIARACGHDPEYPVRRDNALQDAEGELAPTLSGLDVYEGHTYAVIGGHPGSHNSDSCLGQKAGMHATTGAGSDEEKTDEHGEIHRPDKYRRTGWMQ